jgi:predicted esterase
VFSRIEKWIKEPQGHYSSQDQQFVPPSPLFDSSQLDGLFGSQIETSSFGEWLYSFGA